MGSANRLDNAIEKGQEHLPAGRRARYRLSEILVEEVSLVDRAANKRKFLVVKREPQGKDMSLPTDKMEHGDVADPQDGKPADPEYPSMKGMMADKVAEAIERLVSVANKVKEAPEDADMSEDVVKEMKAVAALLAATMDKYPYPSPKSGEAAPEEEMDVDTKKTEEPAVEPTAPAVDATAQALEKVAAAMASLTENVQKGFGDLAERLTKTAAPAAEPAPAPAPTVEEPAPAADPVAEMAKKLEQAETEKRELEAKLQKALEEPPARASSATPTHKNDGGDEGPRVFPLYYNSSVHDPALGA